MTRPRTLTQAVDQAIAAENRAFEATLCRKCAGTGTIYVRIEADQPTYRVTCDKCHGFGTHDGKSRDR